MLFENKIINKDTTLIPINVELAIFQFLKGFFHEKNYVLAFDHSHHRFFKQLLLIQKRARKTAMQEEIVEETIMEETIVEEYYVDPVDPFYYDPYYYDPFYISPVWAVPLILLW